MSTPQKDKAAGYFYNKIISIFHKYDDDNSGSLDKEELQIMFRDICEIMGKPVLSQEEFDRIFDQLDEDMSGSIEYDEFKDKVDLIIRELQRDKNKKDQNEEDFGSQTSDKKNEPVGKVIPDLGRQLKILSKQSRKQTFQATVIEPNGQFTNAKSFRRERMSIVPEIDSFAKNLNQTLPIAKLVNNKKRLLEIKKKKNQNSDFSLDSDSDQKNKNSLIIDINNEQKFSKTSRLRKNTKISDNISFNDMKNESINSNGSFTINKQKQAPPSIFTTDLIKTSKKHTNATPARFGTKLNTGIPAMFPIINDIQISHCDSNKIFNDFGIEKNNDSFDHTHKGLNTSKVQNTSLDRFLTKYEPDIRAEIKANFKKSSCNKKAPGEENLKKMFRNFKEPHQLDTSFQGMTKIFIQYFKYEKESKNDFFKKYYPNKLRQLMALIKMEKDKLQNIVFYMDGILASASNFIKSQDNINPPEMESSFLQNLKQEIQVRPLTKNNSGTFYNISNERKSMGSKLKKSISPMKTLLKTKLLQEPKTIQKSNLLNQKLKDFKNMKEKNPEFTLEKWWELYAQKANKYYVCDNIYEQGTGAIFRTNQERPTKTSRYESNDVGFCENTKARSVEKIEQNPNLVRHFTEQGEKIIKLKKLNTNVSFCQDTN